MKVQVWKGEPNEEVVEAAASVLRQGGTAVIPTDTVYGIVGDATNSKTVRRMFEMKGRAPEKAFPIFVRDISMARRYAYISDSKARFLEKIWPGPVTIVFQHKGKFPPVLTGGGDTIGIRIPNHPFVLELLQCLNVPLVQTSANLAGQPPARDAKGIQICFKNQKSKPDLVIDAGEIVTQSSTVVDFTRAEPLILRIGALGRDALEELFRSVL